MLILSLLLMVCISYAIAFKDDFPVVLVKRSLLFLILLIVVLNLGKVIKLLFV